MGRERKFTDEQIDELVLKTLNSRPLSLSAIAKRCNVKNIHYVRNSITRLVKKNPKIKTAETEYAGNLLPVLQVWITN